MNNLSRRDLLKTAVTNANSDSVADTINLTASCDYALDDTPLYASNGSNGLDPIADTTAGLDLTINGNQATIRRSSGSNYRILATLAGSELVINDVTISNGRASSNGGALYNDGTVTINNSTISNNYATSGSGGAIYQRIQPEMNLDVDAIRRRIAKGATVEIFRLDENAIAELRELLGYYIQVLELNNQPEAAQPLYMLLRCPEDHFVKIAAPQRVQ